MTSFTNKTKSRIVEITQSATPTINTDISDVVVIRDLAQAITSFTTNLSGIPTNKQILVIDIKDNGTARVITWGASFEDTSSGALPLITVAYTRIQIKLKYNSTSTKWGFMSVE